MARSPGPLPVLKDSRAISVRVRTPDGTARCKGTSDEAFLIANGGHDYYVNDASPAGDVFTTAVGNNANSGKTPDRPMATLAALLDAYDLDPGDVIHVDAGTYSLLATSSSTAQDSGVRIEGPGPARRPCSNRGNVNAGSYGVRAGRGRRRHASTTCQLTGGRLRRLRRHRAPTATA